MASEMIERAGFAIHKGTGGVITGEAALDLAGAVLQAIREPSQHMLSDGAFQIFRGERITEDDLAAAGRVWRAMTEAALDEPR